MRNRSPAVAGVSPRTDEVDRLPCVRGLKAAPTWALLRAVIVAALVALISACGWQIRGAYDIPASIQPMSVEGADNNSVAAEVRDNLELNDIELVSRPQAAGRLIIGERTERRVLTVGSSGKVDEYELIYTVEWRLDGRDSEQPLIGPIEMQARRDYTQNPGEVLGQEDQESALLDAMRSDLATRILFRLQAWSPEANSPDATE